jgi:hypothetical protein|nr:MAG TPA: hypothetical protein [Caudoviricetes sp.]
MKSLLIHIGRADIVEAEKQINEQIKDLKGFVSLKVTSNGQNDMAVVLYDGESKISKPTVKIVEFSITDAKEAQKKIDAALEGLDVVSVEPTCIVDMNRLVIVYDAGTADKKEVTEDSETV